MSRVGIRCDCGWKSVYRSNGNENELKARCTQEFATHALSCWVAAKEIERKQKQFLEPIQKAHPMTDYTCTDYDPPIPIDVRCCHCGHFLAVNRETRGEWEGMRWVAYVHADTGKKQCQKPAHAGSVREQEALAKFDAVKPLFDLRRGQFGDDDVDSQRQPTTTNDERVQRVFAGSDH